VIARKLPTTDHAGVIAFSSALFRWCREAFLNLLSLFQMLFDRGSNSRAGTLTSAGPPLEEMSGMSISDTGHSGYDSLERASSRADLFVRIMLPRGDFPFCYERRLLPRGLWRFHANFFRIVFSDSGSAPGNLFVWHFPGPTDSRSTLQSRLFQQISLTSQSGRA
jgi:hypothetical protein